ncbi:MAG: copper homeostasis protein CutC [Treponema sp.]|jgi:copper homeostasis protein|nr:copper homeostasis protein CutC [Treponema sp.]
MTDGITMEVCIENGSRIKELATGGADRVELCDNLAEGGTTVSYGVAEYVIQQCKSPDIKVISMIRPRGGNFIYNEDEINIMLKDIEIVCNLGTGGIVFGCLNSTGSLDREKNLLLARAARTAKAAQSGQKKFDIVFHMAFDHINHDEQMESLRWLRDNGFTRILTHGSADLVVPIQDNYRQIKEYIAIGGIEILPGGGVTKDNYKNICAELGVKQVHGTRVL